MAKAPIEIRSLARLHTEEALDALCEIMRDKAAPPAARASASIYLLNRGWGMPVQSLEVSGDIKQTVMRAPAVAATSAAWAETHVPEQHRTEH